MEITKDELERLYRENTNEDLCIHFGISKPTLIKYIKSAGIELKGKGGGNACGKLTVLGL